MDVPPSVPSRFIRLVARIGSLVSIGLVALILVGELFASRSPDVPTATEWVGLMLFPVCVCLGLVIGWRNEGLGGTLAVSSLVAFYAWNRAVRGRYPGGPYFVLIAVPGALFMLARLVSR